LLFLCYIVNVGKYLEGATDKMISGESHDVKCVVAAMVLFALLILGSLILEFKIIDFLYLLLLLFVAIKYYFIRKNNKDYT
jgi:hypothetical protein